MQLDSQELQRQGFTDTYGFVAVRRIVVDDDEALGAYTGTHRNAVTQLVQRIEVFLLDPELVVVAEVLADGGIGQGATRGGEEPVPVQGVEPDLFRSVDLLGGCKHGTTRGVQIFQHLVRGLGGPGSGTGGAVGNRLTQDVGIGE